MADEAAPEATARPSAGGRRPLRLLFRAPSLPASAGLIVGFALLAGAAVWLPGLSIQNYAIAIVAVFLLPALLAAAATPGLARAFGGAFSAHRSFLLASMALGLSAALALLWRLLSVSGSPEIPPTPIELLFLLGPVLWFRHMGLFGVSEPRHARSLPPALLQPVLSAVGIYYLYGPTPLHVGLTVTFLALGFACVLLLIRSADRPLRREFQTSGVALIRPLLDHVNLRDPGATDVLERFFDRFTVTADLRVRLIGFRSGSRWKATIALPTVHPGPFAALGASDLPRKVADRLGPAAGMVLVPHTPCDHDLDLPTSTELERVQRAIAEAFAGLSPTSPGRSSPLLAPSPGSFARAQLLGGVAVVVATQAPAPTDDIAFAVADRVDRENRRAAGPPLALIDAHNSYIEDEGDLSYGTPAAEKFAADVVAAVAAAVERSGDGPVELGVASRAGFSVLRDGIGPAGIRVLAVRAAGSTTAYVLIDGNNLVHGLRARLLEPLGGLVDAAEVMTTDNHIVHEVDGGVNPVGERIPQERLSRLVQELVRAALQDLQPVQVCTAERSIPGVRVLRPAWTARLLTSLGDTVSMFAHSLATTLLLLLTSSLVVAVAFR